MQPRPGLTHPTSLYTPIPLPLPLVACARREHRPKSTPSVCRPRSPYTLPYSPNLTIMHACACHVSSIAMHLSPPPSLTLITRERERGSGRAADRRDLALPPSSPT